MIYDTKNEIDIQRMQERIKYLTSKGKRIEVKEKRSKRSRKQNAYFHLLCGYYGMEFGYTIDEVKHYIKTQLCADIYVYEKKGISYIKSTADNNTLEMTNTIERFKNHSASGGLHLPEATDQNFLDWIETQLSRYENYQYT